MNAADASNAAKPKRVARGARDRSDLADQQEILRKPVNTLAIVPQTRRITPLFRKTYNVMLHLAQEQGMEREIHRVPLSSVISGLDFDSHDTSLIKRHLRAMASTAVEWQSPTTGEGSSWAISGLIGHAEIKHEFGQNWLEWSYSVKLRQELLQPAVFAKLSLEIISQLRSHGGLALYEICGRYRGVGRTSRQHWSWWRPVLSGKPETEKTRASEYRFFKRDVLKTAIREVNAISDIDVELVEFKQGRFIADLQFLVRPKAQSPLRLQLPVTPVDMLQVTRASKLGIDESQAEQMLHDYGNEALRRSLDALEQRLASAFPEPLRDPYRYLKSIIAGSTAKVEAPPPKDDLDGGSNGLTTDAMALRQNKWQEEWIRRRRATIIADLKSLSVEEQSTISDALMADMQARNVHPSIRKRLQQGGWEHPMVVTEMVRFYATGTIGDHWDRPSPAQLLEVASAIGDQ